MSLFSDARRPTRDERYFALVHDGDCINKSSQPALKVSAVLRGKIQNQ